MYKALPYSMKWSNCSEWKFVCSQLKPTHALCHNAFEAFLSIEHSLRFNRMPYSLDELRGRVWGISCGGGGGGGGGSVGGGGGGGGGGSGGLTSNEGSDYGGHAHTNDTSL